MSPAPSRRCRPAHPRGLPRLNAIVVFSAMALATGLALPTAGSAQEAGLEPLRQGVHFSIGVGGGSLDATCGTCSVDLFENRLTGLSGNLRLGGAVTDRLVIAAEFLGWLNNEAPVYRRVAALNLVFLGYPSSTSGFFVKGGVGGMRAIVEDDFILAQTDTFNSQFGIGFDIPLGAIALTPFANYIYTFAGETTLNGIVSAEAVQPNEVQFGIALTVN